MKTFLFMQLWGWFCAWNAGSSMNVICQPITLTSFKNLPMLPMARCIFTNYSKGYTQKIYTHKTQTKFWIYYSQINPCSITCNFHPSSHGLVCQIRLWTCLRNLWASVAWDYSKVTCVTYYAVAKMLFVLAYRTQLHMIQLVHSCCFMNSVLFT